MATDSNIYAAVIGDIFQTLIELNRELKDENYSEDNENEEKFCH